MNTCKRELLIEVPAEVVQQATEGVARDFQKHAKLPGFRPGKAPLSLIRQRFAGEIQEKVLHQLIPDHFRSRAEEEKIAPVASPQIEEVQLRENEPLRFKAVFEVLPEFELREYTGLEVEYAEPEATDEEVEQGLERVRQQQATFAPVEGRPLAAGDFAEISFEGRPTSGRGNPVKVQDVLCEIGGAETIPEFSEHLRGQESGAELSFPVSYPADHSDRRLAGSTFQYKVKVHAIKQKQVPELNDELARDLGQFETLEQLREDFRRRLREQKERRAERAAKEKLLDHLVDLHDFPVPESLVEQQLDARLERLLRQLASQGVNPAQLKTDWREWREKQRDAARREVRAGLLLGQIAAREGLEVQEAEVQAEIVELAEASRQPPEALRARLTREGSLAKLKSRIRSEKAHDFLYRNAKRVPPRSG